MRGREREENEEKRKTKKKSEDGAWIKSSEMKGNGDGGGEREE